MGCWCGQINLQDGKTSTAIPTARHEEPLGLFFDTFATLELEAVGAVSDEFEPVPFLRLDDAARDLFLGWRKDLEHRLRAAGLHPALESHLAKYRKLVPSLGISK